MALDVSRRRLCPSEAGGLVVCVESGPEWADHGMVIEKGRSFRSGLFVFGICPVPQPRSFSGDLAISTASTAPRPTLTTDDSRNGLMPAT